MNLSNITINYDQIKSIDLIKGEENVSPSFLSLMNLFLSLGMHIRYARYFRRSISEYSIESMTLRIKTNNDLIELDSHGWNYYSEEKYFKDIIKNVTGTNR